MVMAIEPQNKKIKVEAVANQIIECEICGLPSTDAVGGKLAWGGGGFYNSKMGLYRDIVMLIVMINTKRKSVDDSVKSSQDSQFRFLDAFSGCGALALRVAKVLEHVITEGNDNIEASVLANDASRRCRKLIRNNAKINSITSKHKDECRRSKCAKDAENIPEETS